MKECIIKIKGREIHIILKTWEIKDDFYKYGDVFDVLPLLPKAIIEGYDAYGYNEYEIEINLYDDRFQRFINGDQKEPHIIHENELISLTQRNNDEYNLERKYMIGSDQFRYVERFPNAPIEFPSEMTFGDSIVTYKPPIEREKREIKKLTPLERKFKKFILRLILRKNVEPEIPLPEVVNYIDIINEKTSVNRYIDELDDQFKKWDVGMEEKISKTM